VTGYRVNLHQLDRKHFGRRGKPEDVVVGNSVDSYLIDSRGRKYIDFMMGWCVGKPPSPSSFKLAP